MPETGAAIVMITHDLGIVAGLADRVMVMYAGRAVEVGSVDDTYYRPRMPYTMGLLDSVPRLDEGGIAAASFNDHQTFFGESFGIVGADGVPISTGCIAFGIERWVLAWLAAYGPEPERWPAMNSVASTNGGY